MRMLLRPLGLVLIAVVALAGCGPSAFEVQRARTARYHVTANEAFQTGVSVLRSRGYRLASADPVAGRALTVARWYEADGTYEDRNANGNPEVTPDSVLFEIELLVVRDGDAFALEVRPRAVRHRYRHHVMQAGDPELPNWAVTKVENIYLDIYDALAARAVTPTRTATTAAAAP